MATERASISPYPELDRDLALIEGIPDWMRRIEEWQAAIEAAAERLEAAGVAGVRALVYPVSDIEIGQPEPEEVAAWRRLRHDPEALALWRAVHGRYDDLHSQPFARQLDSDLWRRFTLVQEVADLAQEQVHFPAPSRLGDFAAAQIIDSAEQSDLSDRIADLRRRLAAVIAREGLPQNPDALSSMAEELASAVKAAILRLAAA